MGDLYVPPEQELWIGEQATLGTAINPASGSWDMVHCAGAVITPDVNRPTGASGTRTSMTFTIPRTALCRR